ncbi:hypothetical protein F5887DRAFT_922718 [Amanita rubescens]|nr:hypothetical protein F5887DRAFT_922718 [Amanita rubescens]
MPLDATASKRVPKLTERANPAISSSRKRRLSLSSQDETHDTPRQRVRTDNASPVTPDAQATPPVNATPPATTPASSDSATRNPSATDGPEELGDTDETNSSVNTSTNTSDGPLPVNETPEAQLSMLP